MKVYRPDTCEYAKGYAGGCIHHNKCKKTGVCIFDAFYGLTKYDIDELEKEDENKYDIFGGEIHE